MPTDKELMQIALNALEECYDVQAYPANGETIQDDAIKALRARLAQPDVPETAFGETEPVAWMFQHEETGLIDCVDNQQVEWGFEKNNPRFKKIAPLYTAPLQREWVGLTDEEVMLLVKKWHGSLSLASAIEAKLKEKNNV